MAADRRRSWPARAGTVRVRTTVAALLVVGVAMVVGGVMLVAVLRNALTSEVETSARLRATEVAADLESGTRPDQLAVGEAEDLLIQVLDERGEVVRSSSNVDGLPPVARLRPGASAKVDVPIDNDDFLAVAVAATTPDGRLTVVVARVADMIGESTRIVTVLLAVGLPVLLLVVGATTWKVVGRALAPVEAIRSEVDEISAAELHRRVPNPPGDDEVARLARTMNRMLDRLQRAHARQRRFVADASHELRSPVASIRQHAEVALAHPDGTSTAELARTVLAEDLRIQRLVEDLLLLARADEHALQPRRRQVDLDDLVFEEARRLREATELAVDVGAVSAGRVDGDAAVTILEYLVLHSPTMRQALEAVQRDRALAFNGFFVVRVALRVLIARVRSPGGSKLLATGRTFAFALWNPADARAQLMGVVDRHADAGVRVEAGDHGIVAGLRQIFGR